MRTYIDKFGRWHDKPCENGEPSSNNAWIYTAYAKKLGFALDELNHYYAAQCWMQKTRHLNDDEPPISRDEILGFTYLGFDLVGWNFSPWPLPKFDLLKLVHQLWLCRKKDRNFFWKNKLTQVYHLAFMTPFQDRAYFYRVFGGKIPYFYRLISWIDKKIKPKNNSSALIRWLKYDIMPELKVWEEYFGKEHPFYNAVKQQGVV